MCLPFSSPPPPPSSSGSCGTANRQRKTHFPRRSEKIWIPILQEELFLREMSQLPGGPSCPPPPPRSSNTPAACRPKASRTFAPAWSWTHWCCTCKKVEKRKSQFTIPIWKHLFEMRQFSPFDRHSLQTLTVWPFASFSRHPNCCNFCTSVQYIIFFRWPFASHVPPLQPTFPGNLFSLRGRRPTRTFVHNIPQSAWRTSRYFHLFLHHIKYGTLSGSVRTIVYTQPSFLPPPFPYFHLRCWCITFLFLPPPSSCFPIFWMTNSVGSISRFANLPKVNPPPVNPPAIFSDFFKEQLRYFETPYYRSFHEHPTYGFYRTEGKLKDQVIFFEVLSLSDIFGIFWGRWDSGNVNIRREIQCFWPVRSNSSCDLWGRKVGWPPKTILSPEVTHTCKNEDVRGVMTTGLPDVE